MPAFPLEGGWTVWGKTGTGFKRRPDRTTDRDREFGWFVGWARRSSRTVMFARLVEIEPPNAVNAGIRVRNSVLADLPRKTTRQPTTRQPTTRQPTTSR
jgi:beta-lactamase class D